MQILNNTSFLHFTWKRVLFASRTKLNASDPLCNLFVFNRTPEVLLEVYVGQ